VAQIGRKEGKTSLDVGSLPAPSHQSRDGEAMTEVVWSRSAGQAFVESGVGASLTKGYTQPGRGKTSTPQTQKKRRGLRLRVGNVARLGVSPKGRARGGVNWNKPVLPELGLTNQKDAAFKVYIAAVQTPSFTRAKSRTREQANQGVERFSPHGVADGAVSRGLE